MGDTAVKGYVDVWGKHGVWIGDHTGPVSYTTGGTTSREPRAYGLRSFDIYLPMGFTVSGNYQVFSQSTSAGGNNNSTVKLRWFYAPTLTGVSDIAIATAGTGQTNGTYVIAATGGGGSGATAQITIAGGAVTQAAILNPGTGYTSAPTFTVAEGGTPGTLTATIGQVSGTEVVAGSNLSGETIRALVIGG